MTEASISPPIPDLADEPLAVLEEHPIQAFITDKQIQPEDYPIIVFLSTYSPAEMTEKFHNVFLPKKARSTQYLQEQIARLEHDIPTTSDAERTAALTQELAVCRAFLTLNNRYNWAVSAQLERILAGREKKRQ